MSTDEEILDTLSSCVLHKSTRGRDKTLDSAFEHRMQLCRAWGVGSASIAKVIDVGCGQGDSTAVLAYFVGTDGHVTGLDPAPPSYGSPVTLGDSQAFLKDSNLGERVDFVENNLPDFLAGGGGADFDAAVFCHSLWYFSDRDTIHEHFAALAQAGVARVLLAEYTFASDAPEQRPHQLAAQAQMLLHKLKRPGTKKTAFGELNVRDALDFDELLQVAGRSGWAAAKRGIVSPPAGMKDGYWEVQIVTHTVFREGVLAQKLPAEQEKSILDFIPQVEQAREQVKAAGKEVVTMDVAWAVLELRQAE